MDIIDSPLKGRLRGYAILLSASVPIVERAAIYQNIEAAEAIEEAVVSFARAVFSEGGTLVFGGHPTISPLVALIVREYVTPRVAERLQGKEQLEQGGPQVEIYQSEAYRKHIAEATQRLERNIGVNVHWVEAVGDEVADPDVRDRPQAKESMERMRLKMVNRSDLVGMVCIGGMEDVTEEARLFRKHHEKSPIFTLESTGGAAAELARMASNQPWMKMPERGVREIVDLFWAHEQERQAHSRERKKERLFVFPYAYIAQKIVADIIHPHSRWK
jgi:hypothetical protein